MADEIRKTGIDIIGDAPWGMHVSQFYQTKEDLLSILVPYFKAGLENNESCAWITSEPLTINDAKEAMRNVVPDFDRFLNNGQIDIVPHDKWYLKDGVFEFTRVFNGWLDRLHNAQSKDYDGMRVTGNTSWLKKSDWQNFMDYEQKINKVIRGYKMLSICTYPLDKCGASDVMDVMVSHQLAIVKKADRWSIIESSEHEQAEMALRESEDRFKSIFELASDGILLSDPENKKLFICNNEMCRMLGYSFEEIQNLRIADIHPEKDFPHVIEQFEKHTEFSLVKNIPLKRKDGSVFYADVNSSNITIAGKKYLAGYFKDITARKLGDEKLLAAEKLAVMGRLVADVSHELNNPLAIIIGGAQLVLSHLDKKSSQFKKQLEIVLRNAKRCKTILGNLLSYNRTISKKEEAINLPALIREAIQNVGYQYDMSGIETVLNCDEAANAEITGNSTALLSVFVNLVRNARQAMGEKGRLTITMQKEAKKHLRIEIHDTGSGMNAKQKAELFKPFASGWKEREGSGLGLATSLGIIETHGGSMSAESGGVGEGATFTILLPCEFKEKK